MGVYTKPLDLYKAQMKRFARVTGGARALHQDIAEEGFADAKELTTGASPSGKARIKFLRTAGHPFGRRSSGLVRGIAGGKRLPLLPLGRISDRLHRGWSIRKAKVATGQEFQLRNSAPHAKYILHPAGTKKMVGRGIGGVAGANAAKTGEIPRRWKARNKALMDFIKQQGRI